MIVVWFLVEVSIPPAMICDFSILLFVSHFELSRYCFIWIGPLSFLEKGEPTDYLRFTYRLYYLFKKGSVVELFRVQFQRKASWLGAVNFHYVFFKFPLRFPPPLLLCTSRLKKMWKSKCQISVFKVCLLVGLKLFDVGVFFFSLEKEYLVWNKAKPCLRNKS